MTQGNDVPSTSVTSVLSTTPHAGSSNEDQVLDKTSSGQPTLTDTLAAVTIAVLAVVLVITLMLIIRAVRRRRQLDRGEEMDRVPTVSAGIMNADVAAYSRNRRTQRQPQRDVIIWEPVTPSSSSGYHGDNAAMATTSSATLAPAAARGMSPSQC